MSTLIVTVVVAKSHFGSVAALLVKGSRGERGLPVHVGAERTKAHAMSIEDGFKRPAIQSSESQ